MLRNFCSRTRCLATIVALLCVSVFATSCGTDGVSAKEMVLLELQFLDRSLVPAAPTGTENLSRNAIIGMIFSDLVNPFSVTNQTIQLRFGGSFQSVPTGSFSVNGNQVLFDPTITAQGQPNPLGFEPVTQYILDIPGVEEQSQVVQNLDNDPNLVTFFTQFTTSDGWLRELVPPQIEDVFFIPDPNELTGAIPGNGIMAMRFSEPILPTSFELGIDVAGPIATTTLDVRYTDDSINQANFVENSPIPGSVDPSPDLQTFFFRPMFSFGSEKLIFTAQFFQGLKDLSGNLLVNPRVFGSFTCDGTGIATGKVISENFLDAARRDAGASDADWGSTEEGTLQGLPVTSRNAYILGYAETDNGSNSGRGQYAPIAAPLIGADINNYAVNVVPPSAIGRRVMWAFGDAKMGQTGSITACAWGPDSNATFAAFYEDIKLRIGFKSEGTGLTLAPTFSGNYEGGDTLIYAGDYQVQQMANVGNTPGEPITAHVGGYQVNPGCTGGWNAPLFAATGFYPWPELNTFFQWSPGDPLVENDKVLIFDASVPEGDTFQQVRGWFGVTYPCSGVLINGLPLTRMYAGYEEDQPNPTSNFIAGIQNPEQSITDTCFTVTKRVSAAQSEFYLFVDGETFGDDTDYLPAILTPNGQSGGASVVIEYQGADAVNTDKVTINQAAPFTNWTHDINVCDGMQNLRWRISLISNLKSLAVARVTQVVIPLIDGGP